MSDNKKDHEAIIAAVKASVPRTEEYERVAIADRLIKAVFVRVKKDGLDTPSAEVR